MRLRSVLAFLALSLLLGAACSDRGGPEPIFGSGPRFPDAEGVVMDISFKEVTLDEGRRFEILEDVQSFSTYDGSITPLLHLNGRYIHAGLDNSKRVEWVAGIGLVIGADSPDVGVVYNGVVESIEKGKRRVIFEDGTVLTLAKQVELPERGQRVSAKIQPFKRTVVEIVLQ